MEKQLWLNVGIINKTPDFAISNQEVADLLLKTTDYLLENRENIIQKYGWKTYWILLAQSMWCDIPQFFPIPTDFLSNNSNAVNSGDLEKFENLLSQLDNFFVKGIKSDYIENYIKRITGLSITIKKDSIELTSEWELYDSITKEYLKNLIIKDFLLSNLPILKYILNDLDEDNIETKYSFLIDILVQEMWWNWYDFFTKTIQKPSETDPDWYDLVKIKYLVIETDDYSINSRDDISCPDLVDYIKKNIFLKFKLLDKKTEKELENLYPVEYNSYNGSVDFYTDAYILNLFEQLNSFLWKINENTNFSPEQITYLQKVFSKFKNYPFISVRSSANIEDGGDNNNAWIFYTWFCITSNFDDFLNEIKKVLASSKNSKNKNTKMWITVMAVFWKVNHKKSEDEINLINSIYHDSPIWRQLALQNEERYYYPEWGWVMLTNSFWGRVSISSEFWLPVWITSWTWKWFHHDFNADWTLAQARIQEYNSNCYYRPEYIIWFHSSTNSISEIRNYNLRAHILKRLNNSYINNTIYWAFSIETYEKLVKIWKDLEAKLGYPLDIEFVVHDWKPYIIQLRPYINKYKKPEWFEYPDLEWKEIILDDKSWEAIYSMWYLKENSLKVVELEPKFTDVWTDTRSPNKKHILNKLIEQEQIGVPYLVYLESHLSVFPEINKLEFPNFKWFVFLWNQTSIASHISMMLRQNEIPTICVDINNINFDLKDWENVWVFIDWEKNKFVIYK